jgi:hypothetical protein
MELAQGCAYDELERSPQPYAQLKWQSVMERKLGMNSKRFQKLCLLRPADQDVECVQRHCHKKTKEGDNLH